ncbi:dienelactone hydrolase [Streptomyces albus subsp. chlorinus]|uniref:dienelactone hydrolase family protein n=1 Tax=Streptomyces albus TaxID=1888 RepID=UPI00156EB1A5|nr:dienelactone hydrolase [Streptomyces albus subsp. chlorinus]
MAPVSIILFHSVCGLTADVHAAADRLRAAGHEVITPDLFDGRTAASVEEGMRMREEDTAPDRDELLKRAVKAAAPHAEKGLVYAGFSLGGSLAQTLALADEKARGLVLLSGTSDIPQDAAVDDLPVQLHVGDPDAFEPHDWLTAWYLRMQRAGADVEVHRYPAVGHLYTHAELEDYDKDAAERTWRTVLGFLETL